MPAHIGIGDKLKAARNFVIANIAQTKQFRHARQMGGGTVAWSKFKDNYETRRDQRETAYTTYQTFREGLNRYDPALSRNGENRLSSDQNEWDLYLKPDTWFDIVCRQYFDNFEGVQMLLVRHKSHGNKLKRIECTPRGEAMRILWSDAS